MKIKMNLLTLLFLGIAVSTSLLAQSKSDLQRQREIDAVKSYVNRVASGSKTQTTQQQITKPADNNNPGRLSKTTGHQDRKHYFMNANRVSTEVYNYGAIAPGYGLLRGVNNGVWRGLSYIFQFCPIIAAAVPDNTDPSKTLYIISDGLWDYPTYSLREVNPTGDTLWTFQPLPGYDDPSQDLLASNPAPDKNNDGKPDSWPVSWYNPTLGKYVWPGYIAQDATNADLEVFWAMDDRDNREFNYFPFAGDMMRRGIGVQIDGRGLQWSNTLAENTIFFVYSVSNVSEKYLDTLIFGIYGDCDVGGGSPENTDDNGLFIPPYDVPNYPSVANVPVYSRSMTYFWDPDGVGDYGLPVGYVACKYLESPGNPDDLLDNDDDGMTDESQEDGIDNDGDWNPLTDDVGIDGIPNTGDEGEGNGVPTRGKKLASGALDPLFPGEPNFEYTDLDEVDQIGLTSFNSWTWPQDRVSNDESMWNRLRPQNFGDIQQATDVVFVFGSGSTTLAKGETKRISMSLLFGEDLADLLTTAETVQRIYNSNYKFFRPPEKPHVTAVPGDKKVTLYWDDVSEESNDPLTGKDFEGYVIYRSTDPSFDDIQTISDGRGNAFLSTPLKSVDGTECKWDLDNGWKGYHPVPYMGRGIQYYMGDDKGLVHSYVDSNNVINGQTYYYAVVAFDHGDSVGIPPTETTKKITTDPITSILEFDVNTVAVTAGPRAGGYVYPDESALNVTQSAGLGNGAITLKILNDLIIPDKIGYEIVFSDTLWEGNTPNVQKNYSVLKDLTITDQVDFVDTNFSKLTYPGIDKAHPVVVKDMNGQTYTEYSDYIIEYNRGLIRRTGSTTIQLGKKYSVEYRYYPIYQSTLLKYEDGNPVFDGIELKIKDYNALIIDTINTKWLEGNSNYRFTIADASLTYPRKKRYAADYEIRFSSSNIDSAFMGNPLKAQPVNYSVYDVTSGVPKRVWTYLRENTPFNQKLDVAEEIVIFNTGFDGVYPSTKDTLTWGIKLLAPTDTSVTPKFPTDGDILYIRTERPFNRYDRFAFTSKSAQYSNEDAKSKLDNVFVVPNPYVGYNVIEPSNKLPGRTRGEKRIYFENLPPKCTIRIYTLSGDWVQTLEHDANYENGQEYWNLLNSDGFSVSYGIYLAHIDAPGIGEKIVKFALIK